MNTTNTSAEQHSKRSGLSSRTKAGLGIGTLLGGALLAWLAFGVFGIHTAFIDETVNEDNPFASAAIVSEQVDAVPVAAEADTEPDAAETTGGEETAAVQDDADDTTDAAETSGADETQESAPAQEPAENQIINLGTGQLVDHDHSGDGTVNVLTNGEQTFLRFEDDFAVDNGPDLNVYLVRGADAEGDAGLFDDDFIDLGDLKGNIGAQNYELPEGVDVSEYNTVVIWCVRFGVAFNAANIA